MKIRSDAGFFSERYYMEVRDRIHDVASMCAYMKAVDKWIVKQSVGETKSDLERLCNCVKIRYFRKVLEEKELKLTEREREKILETFLKKQVEE